MESYMGAKMSDKYKCSVCGFESERYEDFISESGGNWQDKTSNLLKTVFGTSSISICWVCFFKAFGVKPKEKSIVIGTIYTASNEAIHTNVEVNGIPLNPCDTLTRQHTAEIENEESLKKSCGYEPTLIPGCPAEEKKKAAMPPEGYSVISSKTLTVETFEFEIEKCKCMDNFELLEHVRANVKGKLIFDDIFVNPKKQNYFVVSGTRTYKKESS
jgi:hypothetical protein